ncbi:MAG: helix-turn-helix domain-containing protein [Verrucomicrobia bacterium]|nr:helix-turn-helix domain-containing protein [Verrucomicrobiota bacterium]
MSRTLKKEDWFHADGFPLALERRDPQEPFYPHKHEFSELVIVTGGSAFHVTGDQSWPLAAGDVFVIGPQAHEYRDMKNLRLINILFQPERLKMDLLDLSTLPGYHGLFTLEPAWRKRHQFKSRLHLSQKELDHLLALVDQLDAELSTRAPGFGFVSTALFMQIVGFLSRCYGKSQNADSRALLRIGEAIAHLETNLDKEVSLDSLVQISRMSKRNFIRAFQAAMGTSPISYLLQLRISRAAQLLRSSDYSVTDIAFRVGFTDSNYFTRKFRNVIGTSPRAYRKRSAATTSYLNTEN